MLCCSNSARAARDARQKTGHLLPATAISAATPRPHQEQRPGCQRGYPYGYAPPGYYAAPPGYVLRAAAGLRPAATASCGTTNTHSKCGPRAAAARPSGDPLRASLEKNARPFFWTQDEEQNLRALVGRSGRRSGPPSRSDSARNDRPQPWNKGGASTTLGCRVAGHRRLASSCAVRPANRRGGPPAKTPS